MPPVNTFGSLQTALFEGMARAAPEVAKAVAPRLVPLLTRLDQTWPFLVVAARAYELASKRRGAPTPESILHAVTIAGRELGQDKLARLWLRQKPFWRE
jgi:hypothetical protein